MPSRQALVPALLIAGGVGLIQYHSISFWSDHVSHQIGWAWSLSIEAAGLWLWYRPGLPSRLLGLIASVLLLAGPLYQIASPVLSSRAAAQASAQAAQRLRTELAQDAQLVRTYAQNSQHRLGWLPAIQSLQKGMNGVRARLNTLEGAQAGSIGNTTLGAYALVLLQALGLLLIQTTNVLAITHFSGLRRASALSVQPAQKLRDPEPEPESIEAAATEVAPCIDTKDEHARLRELAMWIRSYIDGEELSIAKAAERLGVDRRDLGYLLNWMKPGDRKPPVATMDKLEKCV